MTNVVERESGDTSIEWILTGSRERIERQELCSKRKTNEFLVVNRIHLILDLASSSFAVVFQVRRTHIPEESLFADKE